MYLGMLAIGVCCLIKVCTVFVCIYRTLLVHSEYGGGMLEIVIRLNACLHRVNDISLVLTTVHKEYWSACLTFCLVDTLLCIHTGQSS